MSRTAALIAGIVLTTACNSTAPAPSGPTATHALAGGVRLGRARSFREYPLYWLGRSYGGMRLAGITASRVDVPNAAHSRIVRTHSHTVSFLYGRCVVVPASTGEEQTCSPPLEVQNWPACGRNASSYGLQLPLPVHIRGAPAKHFGDRVEIWTGTSDVVIFGKHAARAARALESANHVGPGVGPGDRLPAPTPGAIQGKPRCIR